MNDSTRPAAGELLPEPLSISLWIWSWITAATPGEPYHDLERAFQGLADRGFNAIRAEAGVNWCFRPDGSPRGEVLFGPWIAGYSDNCRGVNCRGGGRYDVLQRLCRLMELARQYGIYVILTSWEYQDSTWFLADPAIRAEVYGIPVEDRLPHLARQFDRLLTVLEERRLEKSLAFVEVHNEIDFSEFPARAASRRAHEDAIAHLRQRHPAVPIAGDFGLIIPEMFPDNMQIYNQHLYTGAEFAQAFYRATIDSPQWDPEHPERHPVAGPVLRDTYPRWRDFAPAARNVRPFWQPITYLYNIIDNRKYDAWMQALYPEWEGRIRAAAEDAFARAAAEAARRNLPLVCGEGGFFWPPLGSRFDESEVGLSYFEFTTDLAIRHGFRGYMPTTYSGADHPLWAENPDWLREVNRRFRNGVANRPAVANRDSDR